MRVKSLLVAFLIGVASATTQAKSLVGAIGWIEPVSGVVEVGHDGGLDGVKIEKILVAPEQQVKKGERLAIFSDYERRKAQLDIQESKRAIIKKQMALLDTQRDFAVDELRRAMRLADNESVSRADIKRLEFDVKMAELRKSEMSANLVQQNHVIDLYRLELERGLLTSPIDGTVLSVDTRNGQRVNGSILTVANLQKYEAVVEVSEKHISDLRVGQLATVKLEESNAEFLGSITNIERFIRNNSLVSTDPAQQRDRRIVEVRVGIETNSADFLSRVINHKVRVNFK